MKSNISCFQLPNVLCSVLNWCEVKTFGLGSSDWTKHATSLENVDTLSVTMQTKQLNRESKDSSAMTITFG